VFPREAGLFNAANQPRGFLASAELALFAFRLYIQRGTNCVLNRAMAEHNIPDA
jgi:hypothetical protein